MKAISFNHFISFQLALLVLLAPLTQCLNLNYDTKFKTDIIPDSKLSNDSTSSHPPRPSLHTKLHDIKTTSMKNKDKDKSTIEFSSGISEKGGEGGIRGKVEGRACPYCVGSACDESIPGYVLDPVLLSKLFIALFLGTIAYFCFLFGYKMWSFEPIPYYLSPSFERPGSGPGGYSKMSSRTGFGAGSGSLDWNSILSQAQSAVLNAIERIY